MVVNAFVVVSWRSSARAEGRDGPDRWTSRAAYGVEQRADEARADGGGLEAERNDDDDGHRHRREPAREQEDGAGDGVEHVVAEGERHDGDGGREQVRERHEGVTMVGRGRGENRIEMHRRAVSGMRID
jgi:hypothetical protein